MWGHFTIYGNYELGLLFVDGLKWKNETPIHGRSVETTHDLMNEETSSTEKYGCNATRVDIAREDKESKAVPPQLMNWKAALLGH